MPRPSSSGTSHYLSPARPRLFAHRGLALEAPENTLLAFAAAIGIGATYIETDVHASADGIAMISHDPDLRRVAGRDERVSALTRAALARLDLGEGQHVPTLAEALDAFPETRFNIDVKAASAVQPTVDAILSVGASDRVLVSSFDERRRAAVIRALPGVVSSASARRVAVALLGDRLRFSPAVRGALRGLVALQVPERALGMQVTTTRFLDRLHRAAIEMHVWTVNDPKRMNQLLDLGVDGIVTDRIDLALAVVGDPT